VGPITAESDNRKSRLNAWSENLPGHVLS